MIIGAPAEVKKDDKKIALTPSLVRSLTDLGHKVIVQKDFGILAGFSNDEFESNGAELSISAEEIYSKSDIIVKINQPTLDEYDLLREKQVIFAFFNYSDKNNLMQTILKKKITTISFSKIKNKYGNYPFIKAGSEIVGKTLVRIASYVAEKRMGGALISGATGVPPMKITIVGAGTVGFNAAKTAASVGADVSVLDINPHELRRIENLSGLKIKTYFSNSENIEKLLPDTDILICAVKRKNKQMPPIISAENIKLLKKGALVLDAGLASGHVAVETMDRILTADNPIYENNGILYFCAPDIASFAAKSISLAVSGNLAGYLISAASNKDIIDALRENRELISGVMTYNGNITDELTAEMLGEHVYELSMLTGF